MFVNFPDPKISAARLAPQVSASGEAMITVRELVKEFQHFQRQMIVALANCMDAAASQFERLNQPAITPADLRREAQKLREWDNEE